GQTAAAMLASLGPATHAVPTLDEAARGLASAPDERLVIIGPELPLPQVAEFAHGVHSTRPDVALILIRPVLDAATVEFAASVGISEVVPAGDAQALTDAYSRAFSVLRIFDPEPEQPEQHHGEIVTVFSAK